MADGLIWWSKKIREQWFTVGLVVAAGRIADCPPYARRWAQSRDAREVWREQARAGAELAWLPDRAPRRSAHAQGLRDITARARADGGTS